MITSGIYKAVQHRVMSRLTVAEKHRLLFAVLTNLGMADILPAAYTVDSVTQNPDGTVTIIGKQRYYQRAIFRAGLLAEHT